MVKRGISNVIAEALLIIVGVSLAAALASTVLSRVSILQSRLAGVSADVIQSFSERLSYVYSYYDDSMKCFTIYVKNVGRYPIYPVDQFTVFFGDTSQALYYRLARDASAGCSCWKYEELGTSNGVIEPGELVAIYLFNSSIVRAPQYFKLVTARGTALEVEFVSS
ncbi:MAG: hypothetical protein RMI56_04410 [Sulfolobales archaeon]|nr:hypothetical protein [Sulfolobales archaeon]MDW8083026.1 hypothetical protein [Sulfolobales archaeon]